jgi:hypothetical protein
MRFIVNYPFAILLGVGIAAGIAAAWGGQTSKAQPARTVCFRLLLYPSRASVSPSQEMNMADTPDPNSIIPWSALGYRLVRSCAAAQIQIENEVRLVGPPSDPESKATLTQILKVSGGPTEKIDIPYTGRLRTDDNSIIGKKFGASLPDIMVKIDPTFKIRLPEYMRKHPEEDPNRNMP